MSVKAQQIFSVIEKAAPIKIAEEWDNVGLQIGSYRQDIQKILLTLDVTMEVVGEAIEKGADCIISHHPLLFRGMKKICFDQYKGELIRQLIKNDISVYSAHTNLDFAESGLNSFMAHNLGLTDIQPLVAGNADHGYGCIGAIEPMTADELIALLKDKLKVASLRMTKRTTGLIKKVAICTGSGSEFSAAAKRMGADVFITGDLKYHDAQAAWENGIWVIDAGHFDTEKNVVDLLKEILESDQALKSVEILIAENVQNYLINC